MKKGFTLVELLVVVAIIGVLSSVVLSNLNAARAKGRDAKRMADLRQMRNALELSFNDLGVYPAMFSGPGSTYCAAITSSPGGWLSTAYISTLPTDPSWNGSVSSPNLPYTYEYCQKYSSGYNRATFSLLAKLEQGNGNIDDTIWPPASVYRPSGYNFITTNFTP